MDTTDTPAIERLEKLEAHVLILTEENAGNKATIKILEKKLSKSERKIQRLEGERTTSALEHAGCHKSSKRFRTLKARVAALEQQQKQQIEDASAKFKRVDKLQQLLNAAILKKSNVQEGNSRVEQISSQLESVKQAVEELQADACLTLAQMEDLGSRCTSIQKEFEDCKLSWSKKEEMDSLSKKISCIETENKTSDSRLRVSENKASLFERSLNDIKKEVTTSKDVISSLKNCQDIIEETVFYVDLEQGTAALATDAITWLKRCNKVYLGGNCFNRRTAFFAVPVDGIYLFSITLEQRGQGRLRVGVGPETETSCHVAVPYIKADWAGMDWDARSGSTIMRLKKGQSIGVFVTRLEGEAKVSWCRFNGCLLSPVNSNDTSGPAAKFCTVA